MRTHTILHLIFLRRFLKWLGQTIDGERGGVNFNSAFVDFESERIVGLQREIEDTPEVILLLRFLRHSDFKARLSEDFVFLLQREHELVLALAEVQAREHIHLRMLGGRLHGEETFEDAIEIQFPVRAHRSMVAEVHEGDGGFHGVD